MIKLSLAIISGRHLGYLLLGQYASGLVFQQLLGFFCGLLVSYTYSFWRDFGHPQLFFPAHGPRRVWIGLICGFFSWFSAFFPWPIFDVFVVLTLKWLVLIVAIKMY